MALTDANESVVERCRFDAYGACTVIDPDGSADSDGISDVGNAYTFTGRRLDDESALMQYRHRWYSPALGRFLSRDPLWDGLRFPEPDANRYVYGDGNPAAFGDPLGQRARWFNVCWHTGLGSGEVLDACMRVYGECYEAKFTRSWTCQEPQYVETAPGACDRMRDLMPKLPPDPEELTRHGGDCAPQDCMFTGLRTEHG
jgi:RHS repeat-associated protein